MNLGDIRGRALTRLDDNSLAPVAYTAAEANTAVNEGLQLFAFLTLCLEAQGELIPTPGQWWYAPRTNFSNWIAPLRCTLLSGAKVKPARLAELDALNPAWKSSTAAATRYGTRGWNLLYLYGTGAAVMLTYASAAAALVLDADIPALLEEDHPALADYAMYKLLLKGGAQMLQRGLACLGRYLDVAARRATAVRARTLGLRYDTLPMELERQDLSRLTSLRKDLLPARKEQPAWTPQP